MAKVSITDDSFDKDVVGSEIPVLVDFWAEWCGPCQMQNPIIEEIASEFDGKIKTAKLNVDNNPKTAAKYNIMSIPTIILFKDGKPKKQMIGVQSKEALSQEINKIL